MKPDNYTLRLLRAQSHQLTHEVNAIPEDMANWKPAENEWSAWECMLHIAMAERHVFLLRIKRIVEEDNPQLAIFDEGEQMKQQATSKVTLQQLLADFVDARAQEVALLENADWSRTGQHPMRGSISAQWLAEYALGHTWEHLSQMMRVRFNKTAPMKK
jgi:hypothetical protein